MADTVWILGIHMTKFGKHLDKDAIDLAAVIAEPAQNRLRCGDVSRIILQRASSFEIIMKPDRVTRLKISRQDDRTLVQFPQVVTRCEAVVVNEESGGGSRPEKEAESENGEANEKSFHERYFSNDSSGRSGWVKTLPSLTGGQSGQSS